MRTRFLFLLPLLALAACDASRDGGTEYDLTLFAEDGSVAARLRFDAPVGRPCDAIGCGSGYAEWRARDVASGFVLSQRSGTLYAEELGTGYLLILTPEIADAGISVTIERSGEDRVEGRWSVSSFGGEVDGGAVEGHVDRR